MAGLHVPSTKSIFLPRRLVVAMRIAKAVVNVTVNSANFIAKVLTYYDQ